MTKRSSFVIPPDRVEVAVIVDIWIAPPGFIDGQACSSAEPGSIALWAWPQGNIGVKPAPIRLSALCTGRHGAFGTYARCVLQRTSRWINCFGIRHYCALARRRCSGDKGAWVPPKPAREK